MKERRDLICPEYKDILKVYELRGDSDVNSTHIYMEAQIFTPDSKKMVFHQSAHSHGSDKNDPRHRYLLLDIETGKVLPLTEETGVTAPSVSPDSIVVYYFVNQTEINGGKLTLKKVNIDGTKREVIMTLDVPPSGVKTQPSVIYPISTIRSDCKKIALPAFFGDGQTKDAPWGLMVFDIEKAEVNVILQGQTWCNIHPQYCRSKKSSLMRDIMVQENHGNKCDVYGGCKILVAGKGADIHLIKDDGTDLRDFAWGRDDGEQCQGHQCWRGRSEWAITSTCGKEGMRLIEGKAVPHAGHLGRHTPYGIRNDLSREIKKPMYLHFQTDASGDKMISDTYKDDDGGKVVVMELGRKGKDPFRNLQRIVSPKCSWKKDAHIHPFLSPDGKCGFFNSDESGVLRAYMIKGLENIWDSKGGSI